MSYQDRIYFSALPLIIINVGIITAFAYYGITWPRRAVSAETMGRIHASWLGVFFREFWAWLTEPIINLFILLRMTPNMVTGLSIFMSMFTGYCFYSGHVSLGGWMLALSGSMDTFDGRLARKTGRETRSGAYFDACVDRYSDSFVFMGLLLYFNGQGFASSLNEQWSWLGFAMVLVCLFLILGTEVVSYSKARGEAMGFSTKRGVMQRPERVALLSIFTALHPLFATVLEESNLHRDLVFVIVVVLMAILVNLSAISRIVGIFGDIKASEQKA